MNSERSGRGLTHEAHNRRWRGNTVLGSGKKWRLLCNVSTGAGRMKLVAEGSLSDDEQLQKNT